MLALLEAAAKLFSRMSMHHFMFLPSTNASSSCQYSLTYLYTVKSHFRKWAVISVFWGFFKFIYSYLIALICIINVLLCAVSYTYLIVNLDNVRHWNMSWFEFGLSVSIRFYVKKFEVVWNL
jgi:hypothetical protein